MVRDHDRVGAGVDGFLGVVGIHDALQDQLALPLIADPFHVAPVQRRVELIGSPGAERACVRDAGHVTDDIAERAPPGGENLLHPARLRRNVEDVRDRHARRHREAVLHVTMTLAEHLQVHGEDQRAAVRGGGARDQLGDELAVAHHVELEPERLAGLRRDVLDRGDRHGGETEGDAHGIRSARGVDFAVGMLHAEEPHRRDRERQRDRLAEQRACGRALRHVGQDALLEFDRLEVAPVRGERLLLIGAAFRIVDEHARHTPQILLAQILDAGVRRHFQNLSRTRCSLAYRDADAARARVFLAAKPAAMRPRIARAADPRAPPTSRRS